MASYPMSAVDAAWYHIDGPANLAIVTGIALTKQALDFGKVSKIIQRRLLEFERFRQRVVEHGLAIPTLEWQDIPDFDIGPHLRHTALPSPQDEKALMALVNDLASMPLDRSRPLWQIHIVDSVMGGSAMIFRYHHCIGDGTAMKAVTARLFDIEGAKPRPPSRSAKQSAPKAQTAAPGLLEQAGLIVKGAGALLLELVKWPDPPSPFKGDFSPGKTVAWTQAVSLDQVKAIGASTGAKVNDVLVAIATGALRSYLMQRGINVKQSTLRAMVPVDLRAPQNQDELGNDFGLVILDLPVEVASATKRLALVKARMDALKRSTEAIAMQFLFDLFGRGPKLLEDLANQVFGSKASIVLTNVVGPNQPVLLAGVPIDRLMFCVPFPGDQLGLGLSILSYQGMATLTVIADARLVPDPQKITKQFNRQFAAMCRSLPASKASRH
jgi:WS/DGAT/MGAT family acyltransferase